MNRLRSRTAVLLLLTFGLSCAVGCGKSKSKVEGTITLDGEAVPEGSINFMPADGKGQTVGVPIKEGKYSAEVPVGSYKVEIHSSVKKGTHKPFPDSPPQDVFGERIPEQYNSKSKLVQEIKSDTTTVDFALKSKE